MLLLSVRRYNKLCNEINMILILQKWRSVNRYKLYLLWHVSYLISGVNNYECRHILLNYNLSHVPTLIPTVSTILLRRCS